MTIFPRGATTGQDVGAGIAAAITIPAIPGVVHVLDSFSAKLIAGIATTCLIVLSSSGGTYAGLALALLSAPAGGTDTGSGSGLDLATAPGESLTIEFSTANASTQEFLLAQWHDT